MAINPGGNYAQVGGPDYQRWGDYPGTAQIQLTPDDRFNIFAKGQTTIAATAEDAGNTDGGSPTPVAIPKSLRAGLLLGKNATTNQWAQWNPAATDGTQFLKGVLGEPYHLETLGRNVPLAAKRIYLGGRIDPNQLIIPGESSRGIVGKALEWVVVEAFKDRFFLGENDRYFRAFGGHVSVLPATSYTVKEEETGSTFINEGATGAITPTLPAIKRGLKYRFIRTVAQTITVTGAANSIVVPAGTTATTVVLDGTNDAVEVEAVPIGGTLKWRVASWVQN